MPTDSVIHNLEKIFTDIQRPFAPLGGSFVVHHQGHCVLNTSMGTANIIDGNLLPWTADTLCLNYSTGKGVLVTLIHMLVSKGLLAYDKPIGHYWSEFATNGKADITLRAVLTHQAGLFAITDIASSNVELLDWQQMLKKVEQMPIKGHVGYLSAYSALVSGWVLGGLVEKVTHLSLQKALDTYLAKPLGIKGSIFFELPQSLINTMAVPQAYFTDGKDDGDKQTNHKTDGQQSRHHKPTYRQDTPEILAIYQSLPSHDCWQALINTHQQEVNTASINGLYFNGKNMSIEHYKTAMTPERKVAINYHQQHVLTSKIPAANCVASANALAAIYDMLASGGYHQGNMLIDKQTFEQLSTIATQQSTSNLAAQKNLAVRKNLAAPKNHDAVMPANMAWRLGYHRIFSVCHDVTHGFGHMGYNGSVAWCDPSRHLSMVYVHNFDTTMLTDIRQFALTEAVLSLVK